MTELRLGAITAIDAADWDGLVPGGNPFLSHAFLSALEHCGCVTASEGWQPLHLSLWHDDALTAAAPAYVKGHSHGEFVYDWSFADAWEQAGGRYYPKLFLGAPFTPMLAPHLLGAGDGLARMLPSLLARLDLSSAHMNGVPDGEQPLLADAGFLLRPMWQYHWRNDTYPDFEAFLAALKRRKRKNIRRERQQLANEGWRFQRLRGDQVEPDQWRLMAALYRKTFAEKGNWPNLNEDLFQALGQRIGERLVLVLGAPAGREPCAGALFFQSDTTLYGRYWGSLVDVPFLHFETCYYQGIEHAIEHRLQRFEPGVFGRHKLARGFEPVAVHSAHLFRDPGFHSAVADWLARDRSRHQAEGLALAAESAFP